MPKVDLGAMKERAGSVLDGFTRGQKAMLALAVAGVLVGGLLFTQWSAKPSYVPLFNNLSSKDASAVTQKLSSQNVKYRLSDGGATVLVPQQSVYQLRLDLSSQGLPSTGQPGYALLEKQGITTSEFRQRVDYQRALEGELANTISAIKGVTGANVHIVIPNQDLFTADANKPTASVLVQEGGGGKLTSGQVQAIIHLVASSVEGLDPGDVTVADGDGHVLSAPGSDGATGDARTEQTASFEQQLSSSISEMLVPLVGQGHAVVKVKAALDFDKKQSTSETFSNPDGVTVPVTESTAKETYSGTNPNGATGILGQTTVTSVANGGAYDKESADRTLAVNKLTEQVQRAPGTVSRLSVAVLLDSGAKRVDTAAVQSLVSAAAGIDAARGDTVRVDALKFDTTSADSAAKALAAERSAKQQKALLGLARTIGVLLLVLVILFLAWRSARKATVRRYPLVLPAPIELGPGSLTLDDDEPVLVGVGAESADATAIGRVPKQLAPPPKELLSDHLVDLIDSQPDDVAQMLRGWLADRRG